MQPFSEKFLYHIWDGFHFINPLKTASGKEVEILFQGRWNTSAGPDFLNAIIKLNEKTLKGDIEIHIDSNDWKRHSHDENKNFNNVILQVVFEHKNSLDYTILENGKKIEIVEISRFLDENISKLLSEYKDFEPKEKFCNFFAGETPDTIKAILTNMGKERFVNKVKRFNAELSFRSYNQVLYSALLESCGYSKNKFQMIEAAESLSYSRLKQFFHSGMSFDQFISIFLITTGLFNILPSTFPNQFKEKWLELYQKQNILKESFDISWNNFRIRPINNPAIRFLQIAKIIYDSLETELAERIFTIFSISKDDFDIKKFKKRVYDFFKNYSILPEKYLIGKSRVDVILINVILPLSLLYSQKMQYSNLEKITETVNEQYSGLPTNFILDFMSRYMDSNQRKIINKKSIIQQGVLNLYYSYCNNHLCGLCVLNKKEILKNL